jgi:hypothetical protein
MGFKVLGIGFIQLRDYWRALVNAALTLRVPYAMELLVHVLLSQLIADSIVTCE